MTAGASFFSKERTVAGPGFNRWLVPPAALAIHLCIGMAYGFSVFWLPLSKSLGITHSIACGPESGIFQAMFTTSCDWKVSALSVTFEIFIAVLGIAAALWGGWLEHAGPRKAGAIAAVCWGGGMFLGGIGAMMHQLWLIWLGCGVIGGVGQGLGYISPVSTLIKWFPDRRGMATGMAIMGYGGGASIGAPLAVMLMKHFSSATSVGVAQTLMVMGIIYFAVMMMGAIGYRVPPNGWKPEGWSPPSPETSKAMVTHKHVHLDKAWKTRQFWLIWAVLCLNVTAGIGVLSMASPMLQEVFGGKLVGLQIAFNDLTPDQKVQIAAVAAGFAGLLSLFNSLGRFFWASISDWIGRKNTYFTFFILGMVLYASAPSLGHTGSVTLFVLAFCVILTMYGGGFATVPAYLADMFGTQMVGAIHGRLLTAWSTAGIAGPVLINYVREFQLSHGVQKADAYDITMYILVGLLLLGLVSNALIRPVESRHHMTDEELEAERKVSHDVPAEHHVIAAVQAKDITLPVILAWLAVGIPFIWGVTQTLIKASVLFR